MAAEAAGHDCLRIKFRVFARDWDRKPGDATGRSHGAHGYNLRGQGCPRKVHRVLPRGEPLLEVSRSATRALQTMRVVSATDRRSCRLRLILERLGKRTQPPGSTGDDLHQEIRFGSACTAQLVQVGSIQNIQLGVLDGGGLIGGLNHPPGGCSSPKTSPSHLRVVVAWPHPVRAGELDDSSLHDEQCVALLSAPEDRHGFRESPACSEVRRRSEDFPLLATRGRVRPVRSRLVIRNRGPSRFRLSPSNLSTPTSQMRAQIVPVCIAADVIASHWLHRYLERVMKLLTSL